jgi:hypothetical protein
MRRYAEKKAFDNPYMQEYGKALDNRISREVSIESKA